MADGTKPKLVQLYHTTMFITVKHTLIQAVKKGYFATWPNLKTDLTNKHTPPSMATSKGHMHQTRNNINTTKQQDTMKQEEPLMTLLIQHTNTVFTKIINHKRQIAPDLKSKFTLT